MSSTDPNIYTYRPPIVTQPVNGFGSGGSGTVTQINTTIGDLSGGPITSTGTLSLATVGASGTFKNANITLDTKGRVTTASNGFLPTLLANNTAATQQIVPGNPTNVTWTTILSNTITTLSVGSNIFTNNDSVAHTYMVGFNVRDNGLGSPLGWSGVGTYYSYIAPSLNGTPVSSYCDDHRSSAGSFGASSFATITVSSGGTFGTYWNGAMGTGYPCIGGAATASSINYCALSIVQIA